MIVASMVLILSTALFLFYLQTVCQKLLRREFVEPFYLNLARVAGLEFPTLRNETEKTGSVGVHTSVVHALRCDFSAVAYLMKKASRTRHQTRPGDRMLLLYWRVMFISLRFRHFLSLQESPALLELTAILQYFANVVGARVTPVSSGSLATGD